MGISWDNKGIGERKKIEKNQGRGQIVKNREMKINWDNKERKWRERKETGKSQRKEGKPAKNGENRNSGDNEANKWEKGNKLGEKSRKIEKKWGRGQGGMRMKRQRNEGKPKK